MVQNQAVAGIDSYTLYGVESTYGTKASTIASHFGIVQRVSPSKKNNLIQVRGFKGTTSGGREMVKTLGGKFECGVSIEVQPQNWDWLLYVLGTRTGSGTSGAPYVYTKATNPCATGLTITTNLDLGSTDQMVAYLGCVVNTCTIKAAFGEPVSVTLDFLGADIDKSSTLETAQALSSENIYIFSGATVEYPDASALSHIISSVEMTIGNDTEMRYGLGARTGKKAKARKLEHSIKITLDEEDDTFIDDFLGSASGVATNPTRTATMAIKFTDGATRYIDFVYTGLTLDENNDEQSYGEVIQEDITMLAESLTVTEVQSA